MFKLKPKTLLVVKNRAMGDSIIGLSTIQYLRDILPNTRIIYAVPSWIKPLYNEVETAADEIIELNLKTISDFPKTWSQLKGYKIDTVFELFQSGRTKKFFSLWQALGGPKYVAHNHHKTVGPIFDQGVIKPNIQRDLDGAFTFFDDGRDKPVNYLDYAPVMKKDSTTKKQIVLGVVATRETKMWPLKSYIEFIEKINEAYSDYEVIIPLGPGDQSIEKELSSLTSSQCKIIKASLDKLPKILSGSTVYIGNDTGIKHICIALGIPSYTLFGPEPPLEWHPYNTDVHSFYFREPLECRTVNAHYCGLSTCESMICLNTFTASDLLEKVKAYLPSQ